ncbi:MAG: Uma2 family endonuclease [Myxococcaceae bacterium]
MEDISFESTTTLTREQFARWVERRQRWDPNGYELLNGRVVMNPPAGFPHGAIGNSLQVLVGSYVRQKRAGLVFDSSQGFDLPSGDTLEPDHSFVSNTRWNASGPHEEGSFLRVVPDLIIEVLSASTAMRDRGEKKAIYERNGVTEYVLIDWRARTLTAFGLQEGRYVQRAQLGEDEPYELATLPGLSLVLRELLPH